MINKRTREKIVEILKRNGVKKAAVFGSFARGEEKKNSDIDILVEVPEKMSLLGFIRLEFELEEKLKRKVDLVEYECLHPLLKDQIMKEQIPVF
ncbi:MAG: nucleotidyltransferase family protein [Candidatus Nealsonbacteria bacterium DGGOD1a]|jgi:Predicted nucleotidyltransferases|nr:MAG: nucleotidyltransferase family protein [Candidatus Nealsonbacteria bacterium DGGOD1a]